MLVAKSELAFCSHARQLTNAGFAEVFGLTGGHREWLGGGAADFATSINSDAGGEVGSGFAPGVLTARASVRGQ